MDPGELSPWLVLIGLGAFHGLNPAMGWLFAVALGLYRQSRQVVLVSLIPIALGWIVALAFIRKLQVEDMLDQNAMLVAAGVAGALLLITFFLPTRDEEDEELEPEPQEFDAFAGGYPVPPLPSQRDAMAAAPTTTSQPTDGGEAR